MYLRRTVKRLRFMYNKQAKGTKTQQTKTKLTKSLGFNIDCIQKMLGDSDDVKSHFFSFGQHGNLQGALVYIDGLVNVQTITDTILMPLLRRRFANGEKPSPETLRRTVLCSCDTSLYDTADDLVSGCLSGHTAMIVDGHASGLLMSTKGWETRNISEAQSESVVRGPREGFTEDYRTNTSLLRRRIKNPHFRLEHMLIGRQTKTSVCIAYINGIANEKVIQTVKNRLASLDIDSVMDTGYLEQYIEDAPFSVFPTIGYSEKPDVIAGRILEGRIAIIADGSPFVLTVPMLFTESFQTSEDYYARTIYVSLVRMMRFFAFFLTVFAPAIYIALTTFHQELLPTTLLYTVADAREGIPFTSFFEAFIMIFAYEILREAGIRLPRPVGQAISIVGALIMGDAAVSAGIVGAPMVITIAITAVAGFIVPEQNDSASILRLIAMVFANFFGGYGIAMVFLFMLMHLAALRSFGIPYFETVTPSRDLEDSYIRMPLWTMSKRPRRIAKGNITRRHSVKPPPNGKGGGES